MAANGLAPFTKVGGDFQSYIDGLVADIATMSKELGVSPSNGFRPYLRSDNSDHGSRVYRGCHSDPDELLFR